MILLGWLCYVVGLKRLARRLAGDGPVDAWDGGGGLFD